jgi:hypothetical protein
MDFSKDFENYFEISQDYHGPEIDLNKKLQDTRHALQESQSEVETLKALINTIYSEARVENVATTKLIKMMNHKILNNVPLPRNADEIKMNEKAGYAVYYLKFLGYATRKVAEECHSAKDHLEGMYKSVKTNTLQIEVERTGQVKVPELDGQKELKRSNKPPQTPPATPPEIKKREDKKEKK